MIDMTPEELAHRIGDCSFEEARLMLNAESALSLVYRRLELARQAGETHAQFAVDGVVHREVTFALGYGA